MVLFNLFFSCIKIPGIIYVYKNGNIWTNTYTLDENTLENLKLIKKNSSTIDQKISETKSEIEKLQEQLKNLESEKNAKKIEQLISEMIPGNFYTIKLKTNFDPISFTTGRVIGIGSIFVSIQIDSFIGNIPIKSIKDIIPREDITNDYNNLMEKIKKYNGE